MAQDEPAIPNSDEVEDVLLYVDLILVIQEVEEPIQQIRIFGVCEDLLLVEDGEHLAWVVEEEELGVGEKLGYILVELDVLLEIVEEVMADDNNLLACE